MCEHCFSSLTKHLLDKNEQCSLQLGPELLYRGMVLHYNVKQLRYRLRSLLSH